MSNKIKSLLYFACFVASCLVYYQMEQEVETENQMAKKDLNTSETKNIAEAEMSEVAQY